MFYFFLFFSGFSFSSSFCLFYLCRYEFFIQTKNNKKNKKKKKNRQAHPHDKRFDKLSSDDEFYQAIDAGDEVWIWQTTVLTMKEVIFFFSSPFVCLFVCLFID